MHHSGQLQAYQETEKVVEQKKVMSGRVLHCVWLNQFVWFHCTRGWIVVDEVCLVALIWEDELERICKMGSLLTWRDLKGWNWKLWNSPCKWIGNYEHPFPQGSISNFTNISIKKIKKIYQIISKLSHTFPLNAFRSYHLSINPNNLIIHTQSAQISSNSFQIHSPNQTKS